MTWRIRNGRLKHYEGTVAPRRAARGRRVEEEDGIDNPAVTLVARSSREKKRSDETRRESPSDDRSRKVAAVVTRRGLLLVLLSSVFARAPRTPHTASSDLHLDVAHGSWPLLYDGGEAPRSRSVRATCRYEHNLGVDPAVLAVVREDELHDAHLETTWRIRSGRLPHYEGTVAGWKRRGRCTMALT